MVDNKRPSLSSVFGALSDPTRREMLERLTHGEATVGELARPHGVTMQAISKHLRKLEQAGLVVRRREGREVYCSLNTAPMRVAESWIEAQRSFWEVRLDRLRDVVEDSPRDAKEHID